jgi:hypothetical protein
MGEHETPAGDLRRRARAVMVWSFWTCLWLAPTLTFLIMAVSEWAGWDPARDYGAAAGDVLVAALTGGLTGVGVNRLWLLYREPARFPVPRRRADRPRTLPRRNSTARSPMIRLGAAEATLADLLDRLDDSPVPAGWVERARHAAAATARELRSVAAKIEAVERAMVHAPQLERPTLRFGLDRLRGQLAEGLDGYGRLIAAAGRALAATAASASVSDLTDATDHLAGLARALQELR